MLESNCDLKTHVQNLRYPLPLQIGSPKTTFLGRLNSQLNGNLTAYVFRTKQIYTIGKCVDNYKGSPTSSQNGMNFDKQTA